MSPNELEAAIAALQSSPPSRRLDAIWDAYESDQGAEVGRPAGPAERSAVAEWLRTRRTDGVVESFVVRGSHLRNLAHRTVSEKAGALVQQWCTACETVTDDDGRIRLQLLAPIDVEPWSAQSVRDRERIRDAVRSAMSERSLHDPVSDEAICMSVVSFVPNGRRLKDVDNLVKGLLDSLQGVLYVNDQQIQCLTTRRISSAAPVGAYLLAARVVHAFDEDVVADDGLPLPILSGPRITAEQSDSIPQDDGLTHSPREA